MCFHEFMLKYSYIRPSGVSKQADARSILFGSHVTLPINIRLICFLMNFMCPISPYCHDDLFIFLYLFIILFVIC